MNSKIINYDKLINEQEQDISKYDEYLNNTYKKIYQEESKITDKLNELHSTKDEEFYLEKLIKEFSKTIMNIIDESGDILKQDIQFSNYLDQYLYYIKNFYIISTKEGRTLYFGILLIFISILISFIEITT